MLSSIKKISPREQRSTSGTRRGNYGHDRNDHQSDREGNWNAGAKARGSGRSSSHNNHAPGNVAYSVYRLPPGMKQNSVTSPEGHNPPPSAMMFYPYDHNSVDEAPHLNDGNHSAGGGGFEDQPRYRGAHMSSSPDDPSSPPFPRGK
ncbi:hypothetical protein Bca52824_080074 [Brassica carinata]|uniref:Uncharacterized protein n=1 Tax=Brassica carinata TaxID=52824 RepID=A0A8X7PZP7_BRACI|nr:hypothetical protein Bca52824_080074 [Brassica carinata]